MRNVLITAVVAATAASAATFALMAAVSGQAPVGAISVDAIPSTFDSSAPMEKRVAALEQALSVEREARQILEEELFVLGETISHIDEARGAVPALGPADGEDDESLRRSSNRSQRYGREDGDDASREERLAAAGFTPAEAARIVRRESELRMEAIEARYEAQRSGEPYDFRESEAMREELGDEAYARYLDASGRPVNVMVSRVYDSSPALAAGMRPGDQIVRYDGRRVFSMSDVSDLIVDGEPGENIVVDIVRDGIPMQLSLPRGPLGVAGRRRYRR